MLYHASVSDMHWVFSVHLSLDNCIPHSLEGAKSQQCIAGPGDTRSTTSSGEIQAWMVRGCPPNKQTLVFLQNMLRDTGELEKKITF